MSSQVKVLKSVKNFVFIEDISISVKDTDYTEVSISLVRTIFTILNTIKVFSLGGRTNSLIKIIN